jgi:hypothetical protein
MKNRFDPQTYQLLNTVFMLVLKDGFRKTPVSLYNLHFPWEAHVDFQRFSTRQLCLDRKCSRPTSFYVYHHHHRQIKYLLRCSLPSKILPVVPSGFYIFRFCNNNFLTHQGRQSWSNPNLEVQVSVFISPSDRVVQLNPQTPGSLFLAFDDSQGYGWNIPTRLHTGYFIIPNSIFYHHPSSFHPAILVPISASLFLVQNLGTQYLFSFASQFVNIYIYDTMNTWIRMVCTLGRVSL